jgi:hypothetical protein
LTSKTAAARTAEQDEHSDLVGGSSAARRLNCPGSYQMEQKLPPSDTRESSSYADEGTALHECMQYILGNGIVDLEEVVGMTFGISETSPAGYVITNELMRDAIVPCVDFFDDLDDRMQAEGGLSYLVEQRCQMPGIPGAFGTTDLICRTDVQTFIVDWKFGAGVPVKAYYPDSKTGEIKPNPQLMFYARAAMHTCPTMFGPLNPNGTPVPTPPPKSWPVTLYIVQPRSRFEDDQVFSERTVHVKDLEDFRMDLVRAVAEAQGDNPSINRGDHCRFAKCKKICPHFTQPGFQLVQMAGKLNKMKEEPLGTVTVEWNTLYAELLDFAVLAELAVKEIRAGAHAFMESGEKIPGWKLVDKRGTERYIDEQGAVKMAVKLGIIESQCFTMETKSPAQLREVIEIKMPGTTKKARTEAAKAEIAKFTVTRSSGTTLAKGDDNRNDAITHSDTMSSLSSKLAALTGR